MGRAAFADFGDIGRFQTRHRLAARGPHGFEHIGQQQPRFAGKGLPRSVFLFVRETAKTEAGTTSPFVFLGAVDYVGHKGSQPVGITWRLRAPMPEEMLQASVAAVG